MIRKLFCVVYFVITILFLPAQGNCCTSFHLIDRHLSVVGKNYDWLIDGGAIFINKRGVKKTAFIQYKQKIDNPATWTSKYGSVTFGQYGIELPGSGMNEKGLVISTQAIPGMKYPELDSRPSIERRQWVQYQLDNYETVAEVIANFKKIQIRPSSFPEHYFIADARGQSAAIEFVDGDAQIYTGWSLPHRAMTNTYYRECTKYVNKALPEVDPRQVIGRFVTVAKTLKEKRREMASDPINASFKLLKEVDQDDMTKWSVVYDTRKLQVFYRSAGNANIRSFDLNRLDLSCDKPVQMLEIEHAGQGEMTNAFQDFNLGLAFYIVYNSFEKSPFIQHVDPAQILHRVTYLGQHVCEIKPLDKEDFTLSNDVRTVKQIIDAWENNWNAKDADSLLRLIHEDARVMCCGASTVNKKKYAKVVAERMRVAGRFKFKKHKIEIAGNTATVDFYLKMQWGTFKSTFKLILEDGNWLVTNFKYQL